jgi:hypothetical protein
MDPDGHFPLPSPADGGAIVILSPLPGLMAANRSLAARGADLR